MHDDENDDGDGDEERGIGLGSPSQSVPADPENVRFCAFSTMPFFVGSDYATPSVSALFAESNSEWKQNHKL